MTVRSFGKGTSTFTCSTLLTPHQRVHIHGTQGRIELEIPFNAPPNEPCRIWHDDAAGNREELWVEACDQYTIQGDLFARSVLNNTPLPTPLSDSVANMRVIEAIRKAGVSGSWERV